MADAELKPANSLRLFLVILANVAVYYGAVRHDSIIGGDWGDLFAELRPAIPACLGAALTGVVNALLPALVKARIVFLRWHHPLPGSRAFSQHAPADPRIDVQRVKRKHGLLPTDPGAQNQLWYQIYCSVRSDPAVMQVHRSFLFTRDYTCLALMLVVVLGSLGMFQIQSVGTAIGYLGLLSAQFLLVRQAAKNHGIRLVTTVLALDSARGTDGSA